MKKRKLDYSGPAVKKSKVYVSEPGKHDDSTKFKWVRVVRPNSKYVGVVPSVSKKNLLKDGGLKHFDDFFNGTSDTYTTTIGYKTYQNVFEFSPPRSVHATDLGQYNLMTALGFMSMTTNNQPAAIGTSGYSHPVYVGSFQMTKTFINASNVVADIWLTECYPRGSFTQNAAFYVNTKSYTFDGDYATSGFDTTQYDSTAGNAYPSTYLLPNFHWSQRASFTKNFKVTAEKHFSVPPGGKIELRLTLPFNSFIDAGKYYLSDNTEFPNFLPQYMISIRGELCLGGAKNAAVNANAPDYAAVQLASYVHYRITGQSVDPNMFGSVGPVFGVSNTISHPAALHRYEKDIAAAVDEDDAV